MPPPGVFGIGLARGTVRVIRRDVELVCGVRRSAFGARVRREDVYACVPRWVTEDSGYRFSPIRDAVVSGKLGRRQEATVARRIFDVSHPRCIVRTATLEAVDCKNELDTWSPYTSGILSLRRRSMRSKPRRGVRARSAVPISLYTSIHRFGN